MPSIAGFYASHEACREWLKYHRPDVYEQSPTAGAGPVRSEMSNLIREKMLDSIISVEFFPSPGPHGALGDDRPMCIMAVCSEDQRKTYVPPGGNRRSIDLRVKACIEEEFGLAMTDWTVLWYQPGDPDMITEFVPPEYGVRDW
ncbi:hypothetical protein BDV93DRAFT_522449 [Ceratobasidium sp. AG-I]|nr:hypothetical protein BDV93DRAFT_522449 [Ceratobasidium sp. AG-I]